MLNSSMLIAGIAGVSALIGVIVNSVRNDFNRFAFERYGYYPDSNRIPMPQTPQMAPQQCTYNFAQRQPMSMPVQQQIVPPCAQNVYPPSYPWGANAYIATIANMPTVQPQYPQTAYQMPGPMMAPKVYDYDFNKRNAMLQAQGMSPGGTVMPQYQNPTLQFATQSGYPWARQPVMQPQMAMPMQQRPMDVTEVWANRNFTVRPLPTYAQQQPVAQPAPQQMAPTQPTPPAPVIPRPANGCPLPQQPIFKTPPQMWEMPAKPVFPKQLQSTPSAPKSAFPPLTQIVDSTPSTPSSLGPIGETMFDSILLNQANTRPDPNAEIPAPDPDMPIEMVDDSNMPKLSEIRERNAAAAAKALAEEEAAKQKASNNTGKTNKEPKG